MARARYEIVSGVTRSGGTPADVSSAARPGRVPRQRARQADASDGPVLALERHHVRDGADGREVSEAQRVRRAIRLVRQQELRHLERDPGPGQTRDPGSASPHGGD